ncbi:MAG: hypothetical protein AAF206_15690 [Bacteroidota bacterium]
MIRPSRNQQEKSPPPSFRKRKPRPGLSSRLIAMGHGLMVASLLISCLGCGVYDSMIGRLRMLEYVVPPKDCDIDSLIDPGHRLSVGYGEISMIVDGLDQFYVH